MAYKVLKPQKTSKEALQFITQVKNPQGTESSTTSEDSGVFLTSTGPGTLTPIHQYAIDSSITDPSSLSQGMPLLLPSTSLLDRAEPQTSYEPHSQDTAFHHEDSQGIIIMFLLIFHLGAPSFW